MVVSKMPPLRMDSTWPCLCTEPPKRSCFQFNLSFIVIFIFIFDFSLFTTLSLSRTWDTSF
jgi:hypothetical protein